MSADTKGAIRRVVLKLCRRKGVMQRDEMFDPFTMKPKAVFLSAQFVFTHAVARDVPPRAADVLISATVYAFPGRRLHVRAT